jgi:predicted LPLAT superfamily acyltransferase
VSWTGVAERGSVLGMRLTIWVYRFFGPRVSAWFILPIVGYFFVTDRQGRRASRRYLERIHATPGGAAALGHRPGLRDCFRHYQQFGLTVLDRLAFTLGRADDFDVTLLGGEHVDALPAGRGAVLVGAHLGNFDALRALARRNRVVVNAVMFTQHAPRINALLRELSPDVDVRVLQLDPAVPDTALRLRACIERGEFVSILGDRVGPSGRPRVVRVPFLGAEAPFPQGPFVLAGVLGCPVFLIVGLRRGDGAYEIFVEPLADRVPSTPRERAERLPELVARYARRLEAFCLRAPYQWFNFYDFWGDETAGARRGTRWRDDIAADGGARSEAESAPRPEARRGVVTARERGAR